MPTPNPDEDHDEFIARCMEDEESQTDFPDPDQRLAFCESVWEEEQDMTDFERRVSGNLGVETRADGGKRLVGHAAVFNSLSSDLGGFREKIAKGAFAESISSNADIRALWNHNDGQVLGRTSAGTLTVSEDDVGLRVEIDPPETQVAKDAMISIERGDVNQMSFAFKVRSKGQEFSEGDDGTIIRTLNNIELFEVSPVTFPAYEDTRVDVRALRQFKDTNTDHIVIDEGHDYLAKIKEKINRKGNWCEFRKLEDGTQQILIYDEIGFFGMDPKDFVRKLREFDGQNLHIRINSPGGAVFDGAAIYNALRQHNGFVTVDIDGLAASMAGIIAMAGHRVRMNQNAFFMMHNASSMMWGQAKDMRHEADLLDKVSRSLGKTLSLRAEKSVEEIQGLMNEETWLDADEAKALGLVDEVMNEMGASLRHHDLSQFNNVPDKLVERRRLQLRRSRLSRKEQLREKTVK